MELQLISRDQLFEQNLVFAKYVSDWQAATFDVSENLFAAGESVFVELGDEEPTILTNEQAEKLNAEYISDCASQCDDFKLPLPTPTFCGQLIAELPASDFESFSHCIGTKMRELFDAMGWKTVLAVPVSINSILRQKNNFPPVVNAKNQLIKMGISPDYSAGVSLKSQTIEAFFENVVWLVRCNATCPNIAFSDAESSIIGVLCKYGNIHFECYSEGEKTRLLKALKYAGFAVPDDNRCSEKFSPDGVVEGRFLDLG